jgi:TRAP-type C4-dicarboxylate transport system permease small subunit
MFRRFTDRTVYVLLAAAALLTFALSFLVVADVIGRGAFNSPVKGTPEIVSMSIVIVTFLLAGYAVHSGAMLQTDVLASVIGDRVRIYARLASSILGTAFFALIVWGSIEPLQHAWASGEFEGEGALRVPVWPARFVVMFGALLVALLYLRQTISVGVALARGETAAD